MGLRSMPVARKPAIIASTSTVPDPQNGSRINCPDARSMRRAAVTG
jgi:hypothetical protein